jgi:hypothetical protein
MTTVTQKGTTKMLQGMGRDKKDGVVHISRSRAPADVFTEPGFITSASVIKFIVLY